MSLLNLHDIQTACWGKLKKHYEAKLAEYRIRLENPNIEERERVALCWKIDTIKGLMLLDQEARKNVAGAGE